MVGRGESRRRPPEAYRSGASTRRSPARLEPVVEAIAAYEAAVADVRRDGLTKDLPNDAAARVFALGFVLDQFRRNLEDVISRTMEVRRSKQEPHTPG